MLRFFCILLIQIAIFVLPLPVFASNSQYQQCLTTTNCTVGEFLYDDEYQPIAVGATCTLTSRDPNGTIFLNSVPMTPNSDGWYSYSVGTSGLATGLYRGQMCCTVGPDYLCLDKTFEVSSGMNNSIVADIWAYPGRSLDNFSSIISGIWSNPNRTLTSSNLDNGTSLATSLNLSTLSAQVSQVQTSVDTIDTKVTSLQTQVGTIATNTSNILAKWSSYSVTDILNYVDTLETQLGNNTQTCSDNTVFGHTQCLIDKWGADSASTIYLAANNAYTTINSLRSELDFNGKSTTAYNDIQTIKSYVDSIESSIGSTADTSSSASIFGRIKQVKEAVDAIDNSTLDLNDLMDKWGTYSATDIYTKVTDISAKVESLNTISNTENITNITNTGTSSEDLKELKNQILAMRAILDVNKIQLERIDNKPIIKTWLEEGSIIFKTLITNPSASTRQKVPFVYNLPPEVKQEYIIKKSSEVEVKYDSTLAVYYITGEFDLAPRESITVEVEVEDIWTYSDDSLKSYRTQAEELFKPLKSTSYFAQGTSLYSDILVSLDKITEIQRTAKTPEDKIKNFREAKIEMDAANRKLESLKTIVTQAGSMGTLSGFIGGVQTMAVWGIVVVLVAGFVFLGLYIRSLNSKKIIINTTASSATTTPPNKKNNDNIKTISLVFFFGISFGASSTFAYYFGIKKINPSPTPQVLSAVVTVAPSPTLQPTPTSEPEVDSIQIEQPIPLAVEASSEAKSATLTPTATPIGTKTTKKIIVTPSINSYVNVRSQPVRNGSFVTKILSGQELPVLSEKFNDVGEKWVKISANDTEGWVLGELVQYVEGSYVTTTIAPSAKITIAVPSHDQVFLYSRPSFNASVTHKLTESQSADILVETKRWAKVILTRSNVEGWISQDFIEKSIP